MKTTTKKALVFGTALAVMFFAAPGAQSKGVHKIRTQNLKAGEFSGSQPDKKFIAHKKKKSARRKSKDRASDSMFSMVKKDS